MAHELEHDTSAIYAYGEPAWHRLGLVVDDEGITKERILNELPEFASDVHAHPLYVVAGDDVATVEGHVANIRELDGRVLGVVSANYQIVQNTEMLTFGEDLIDEGGAVWDTAGTLRDGKVAWACMRLPDEIRVLGMEDERMQGYLMLGNAFDGSMGFVTVASWVRTVCMNTFQGAIGSAKRRFSLRHTSTVHGRIQEAKRVLALTYEQGAAIDALAAELAKVKVKESDVIALANKVFPYPKLTVDATDRVKANIDQKRVGLVEHWKTTPNIENVRDNRWGVLNALSEYEQHVLMRERSADVRMEAIVADSTLFDRGLELLRA
jgi:phage/plasmid-like protein (TIGR03299 family)